jgi:hypothetical protein
MTEAAEQDIYTSLQQYQLVTPPVVKHFKKVLLAIKILTFQMLSSGEQFLISQ